MIEALTLLIITGAVLLSLAWVFDTRSSKREDASLNAAHEMRRGAQALAANPAMLKRPKRRPV